MLITDRAISGSVSIEAPTIAQKDYFMQCVYSRIGQKSSSIEKNNQTAKQVQNAESALKEICCE